MNHKLKILFLCTGNSCRSQMAEGWARALKRDAIEPFSAGIETHGLNPRAVKVMAEAGVDISRHRSKAVEAVKDVPFDYVFTVCGHANETCPIWLSGKAKVVHVGFDDPPELAKDAKSEDEALSHYRRVRDEIRKFVLTLPASMATASAGATTPTNTRIETVQARFDQVASEWDSNPGRVALARGVVDAIRTALPLRPEMSVMDFGAGTGLVTLGLLPYVGHLTAVDASREMLKVLDQKLKVLGLDTVRTFWSGSAAASLPDASFDLLVSSMVLHHIPDVPQTLARLRACLRPGGWIALADLDREDGSFHTDPTGVHHHGFDRGQVGQWLRETGFRDTCTREAHRVIRPLNNGKTREYPVFLATGRTG